MGAVLVNKYMEVHGRERQRPNGLYSVENDRAEEMKVVRSRLKSET